MSVPPLPGTILPFARTCHAHLIARDQEVDIKICSLEREKDKVSTEISNLRNGMPDNPIIKVSRELLSEDQRIAVEGK